ncbi:MAG: hypothetical protein ACRCXX_14080 [Cetobacterium sp.]|uniref:hypothetical protein n=1 Tax=Cetobacterium sp. TaxID=2071632 RepID=UPI003F3CCC0A
MNGSKDLEEILGYEIAQKEAKKYIVDNPTVREEVEKWLTESMGKGHLKAIRRCNLHILDEDVDPADMDEYEYSEYQKKEKHNFEVCPGHKSCPVFMSGTVSYEEKCILELVETQFLIKGLLEELEVEPSDMNDQILISQLVAMNIVYNRALEGLSAGTLVEKVKTYQKGSVKVDTKVNEFFAIVERSSNQMEKLRKSLLLNRDDKLKVKAVKKANSEQAARKRVESTIKELENNTSINKDWVNEIAYGSEKVNQKEIKSFISEEPGSKKSDDDFVIDI